jgi:transposase
MSKTKRNRYSGEFKAKVAREAMREESTIVEIATRYNIHPNQVTSGRNRPLKGLQMYLQGRTVVTMAHTRHKSRNCMPRLGS